MNAAFSPTLAAILLTSGLLSSPAWADDKKPDAVRAEALFDDARRLMSAHDYAAACPRLAESETLDPAPGTAINLALCYEKEGKLATAWAAYKTALAMADRMGQKDRVAVATKSAAALEPKLSHVTITVAPPSRASGLAIRLDGEPVGDLEWGSSLPVDGGGHDVQASAPGKKTWAAHLDVKDSGARVSLDVPVLEDAPVAAAPLPVAVAPTPHETPMPATDEPAAHRGNGQRIAGAIIGGAGVVALGVGGILGLVAKSQFTTANGESGDARVNDSASAVHLSDGATIVVIGGAVAAAAGVVIWLTAPHAPAQVGTNGRELFLRAAF